MESRVCDRIGRQVRETSRGVGYDTIKQHESKHLIVQVSIAFRYYSKVCLVYDLVRVNLQPLID